MTHPTYTQTGKEPFLEREFGQIDPEQIPQHVAIIMDGNRRWARKRNKPIEAGHWRGARALDQVVHTSIELGIKALTVYCFSTENWKRSSKEIDALMLLLETYLINKREILAKEGVRLRTIGDVSKLPDSVQRTLREVEESTEQGSRIDLILALNYGGRDDIRRAAIRLIDEVEAGRIQKGEIEEKTIGNLLDTSEWRDPDILIRPGGDVRISNFLIWQMAYSEIYYTEVLWPDFSRRDLLDAIREFQMRNRRFGS